MQASTDAASARAIVKRYLDSKHADMSVMADDVTFTAMATGDVSTGPDEVAGMLHYLYHVAFDADAEIRGLTSDQGTVVLEADFVGKHIGEFAGMAPTGKSVRVPFCVVYDVADGLIRKARIYFEIPALLAQLQ